MSDHSMGDDRMNANPQTGNHGGYEHQDLSPRGVLYFMIGLAVVIIVIYFIVFGMYHFLDTYNHANQLPMSPMVAPEADTRTVTDSETQAFPQPRLEKSERTELREFIEDEDRKLATYNWIDKDKGIVQIPIERAMDLIVERGLPVHTGNAPPENAQPNRQAQGSALQNRASLNNQVAGKAAGKDAGSAQ